MNPRKQLARSIESLPEHVASGSVERSRETAVSRLYRGSLLAVGGAAVFVGCGVYSSLGGGLPAFLGAVAGLTLFGTGGVLAGLAGTHLFRYGGLWSSLTLTAVAGLGASASVNAVTALMLWLRVGEVAGLNEIAGLGVFWFGAFLAIQTLVSLLRWVFSRSDGALILV